MVKKHAPCVMLVFLCIVTLSYANKMIVLNPYENVDWSRCGRYKANLHTHTTESDGRMALSEVIDEYCKRGYSILSITDHDEFTWPWTWWGCDPDSVGLIDIPGTEASSHHHINSFFCDYNGSSGDIETSLSIIEQKGGLAQINHPGRYFFKSISWYKRLYDTYDILVAMEVFNQGNRYPYDRETWDKLLARTMPERPVWATSGDDMHKREHLGKNWQVMLTENGVLDSSNVRSAFKNGQFYICYDKSGTGENSVNIDSIIVENGSIKVYAECADEDIRWISEGREVHRGGILSLDDAGTLGVYVRAEIHGPNDARTLTQPFGLDEKIEHSVSSARNIR
ncbi:MAG: hypothetical protein GF401_19020 [Chitinivibrionales bacterium]|nr:hypothetical protein [Chitinivibrionales bacterium]